MRWWGHYGLRSKQNTMRIPGSGSGPITSLVADDAQAVAKKGTDLGNAATGALGSAGGAINMGFAAGDFLISAALLKKYEDALINGNQKLAS